jgi:murein DD-endopeptidase MepM/ murein hydrolase activator NlpD
MRPLALKKPRLEGEDVKEIQRALGFAGDAVDGVYGPDTASAVELWKWAAGYPERRINNILGLRGQSWLLGHAELPADFKRRAEERLGRPFPSRDGIVRPISTNPGPSSEFLIPDPEGAPAKNGKRYHAAKDWFAAGGSPVRAPVAGTIVEAKVRKKRTGQVFGGTVKIEDADGRVWVFRHVDPAGAEVGQRVEAGQMVARVTDWRDGADHAHIELWKTAAGGYALENMLDPMRFLR